MVDWALETGGLFSFHHPPALPRKRGAGKSSGVREKRHGTPRDMMRPASSLALRAPCSPSIFPCPAVDVRLDGDCTDLLVIGETTMPIRTQGGRGWKNKEAAARLT